MYRPPIEKSEDLLESEVLILYEASVNSDGIWGYALAGILDKYENISAAYKAIRRLGNIGLLDSRIENLDEASSHMTTAKTLDFNCRWTSLN